MLNYLWASMILVGIVYAVLTGNVGAITDAALDSAGEGISLCITMAGVMGLWMGLMEIAQESGMVEKMTKGIKPFLRLLFPRVPEGHKSLEYIATNMIANVLGLGWACTPAGIKAMEELANLEKERGNPEYCKINAEGIRTASNEMCIFIIVNISSLQLLPINIIAYRSQYGSVNPAAIVGPAILATIVSALVGILYCLVKNVTIRRNG
ncbi:MAG: nucleoside recognition protein [Lachnospiraceae bacterium]|nr:nucleoside recognition protein [Lachnospiraceae bacterium]